MQPSTPSTESAGDRCLLKSVSQWFTDFVAVAKLRAWCEAASVGLCAGKVCSGVGRRIDARLGTGALGAFESIRAGGVYGNIRPGDPGWNPYGGKRSHSLP